MTRQAKYAKKGKTTPPQTMRNLEECTRQLTRMMDLVPSDFTAATSTLPAMLFFQFPKQFWKGPEESVWFVNQCLSSMMKELSKTANLSQVYTNHCIRATAIILYLDAFLSNRHIMTLSGHRNENFLRSHNARPS